ncbi:response regulator [Pseudomonas sp. NPDC087342]|uniref:response regulator n=1 Tax=Pseudomonas sp. NPDC087342 TaxID=3364437 RepID=UPI003803078C
MSVDWKDGRPVHGRVIVIEDEPVVRMLLEELLAELGYASAGFDNAVQALSYLVHIEGDCALIIADQGLPGGMRGTDFIRMANERWPSIPSILVSGYSVEEELIPLSTTFLKKPYTLAQLESTIATATSYLPRQS